MRKVLLLIALLPWWMAAAAPLNGQERAAQDPAPLVVLVYSAPNCPHCIKAQDHLQDLAARYPAVDVEIYDIWHDRDAFKQLVMLADLLDASVSTPAIFIGQQGWFGFSPEIARQVEATLQRCLREDCLHPLELAAVGQLRPYAPDADDLRDEPVLVLLPWLGEIDARRLSLPLVTVLIGLMDSFNPCAFFVLLFLLSLLVHLRSRGRMLLVGGIFIFFSGLFYFLFMAAWLNLFLRFGQIRGVTLAAGGVAVVLSLINIKDFFFFQKGVSLSIPETAKPRLFQRMRGLLKASRLSSMIGATIVLAAAANTYELLCTAGFPMIYTRVLTLHELSTGQYYLYLCVYNIVYVIPLLVILLTFTMTLGAAKLSEWQGRVLKLLSGTLMLMLGLVLLVSPALLNQVSTSIALLALAVLITLGISGVWHRHERRDV